MMATIKRVRKLSGKRLSEETARSSLKTLVRQFVVKGRKSENEKLYKLAPPGPTAAYTPSPTAQKIARVGRTSQIEPAALAVAQPLLRHKPAVGEILVHVIGETYVETTTNVHGRAFVENHLSWE